MIVCGLMSGTSLDGIDAALVAVEPRGAGYATRLLAFETTPLSGPLLARIARALPPHEPSPRAVAELDAALGDAFAAAVARLRDRWPEHVIAFVASHGLTLYHDGDASLTTQIGDPYRIRDAACATVVCDFRRADCARGGAGAPLVPYVDALLYGALGERLVALNIGGIANLTLLDPVFGDVRAWDTGPGNLLLDTFVSERTNGSERFDRDGARAARGRIDEPLLAALLADPYFARRPPKSTGRERFGAPYLARFAGALAPLSLEDGCATLAAFTAETIARDLLREAAPPATVVASGGGARNSAILAALSARAPGFTVTTSDAYGIDADAKEAIAFAVLGYETLRGRAASLPAVTGAATAAVLGAIIPHDLTRLLAAVARETEHRGAQTSNPAG